MTSRVQEYLARAANFEAEAHALLESHEGAHRSRVIVLDDVLNRLDRLNLRQEYLFRQALRCTENGIHLAAHVMAWAAFMDLYEEKLASDGLAKLAAVFPKWPTKSLDDLREEVVEFQLIGAGQKVGLLTKGQKKTLEGFLHARNQAAHPTGFEPGINETLGYVEGLLKLAGSIQAKRYP